MREKEREREEERKRVNCARERERARSSDRQERANEKGTGRKEGARRRVDVRANSARERMCAITRYQSESVGTRFGVFVNQPILLACLVAAPPYRLQRDCVEANAGFLNLAGGRTRRQHESNGGHKCCG